MEEVCILLSVYNGETYLLEQLDSILRQKGVKIHLIVRDDGSNDKSLRILKDYQRKYEDISILENSGENLGTFRSFMTLLKTSLWMYPNVNYFFFCDQDDVWFENKCLWAVQSIGKLKDREALYFSRKRIVDSKLNDTKKVDKVERKGNIWDLFTKSNASGCTMCLTKTLAEQFQNVLLEKSRYLHDSYIYRTAICMEIPIIFDHRETLNYRQHGKNTVGASKRSIRRLIKKMVKPDHYLQGLIWYIIQNQELQISDEIRMVLNTLLKYNSSFKYSFLLIKLYLNDNKGCSIKEKIYFILGVMIRYY